MYKLILCGTAEENGSTTNKLKVDNHAVSNAAVQKRAPKESPTPNKRTEKQP